MLGKGGLLNGLAATTYHMAFEELKAVALNTVQRPDERWVDNGRIVTSAGVSAGLDTSLYVVGKLLGAVRPTRRPTTWGRSTGTVCRCKNRNERREARTEKTRWANFPIVDGARGRDQGRPGGYVPELHDAGLVFIGCIDAPWTSCLNTPRQGRRDRSILINMQPKEWVNASL